MNEKNNSLCKFYSQSSYSNSFVDKTSLPSKQSKDAPIEKIPYAEIQGTMMKPLKLLENINTSFFVGTEVSFSLGCKLIAYLQKDGRTGECWRE